MLGNGARIDTHNPILQKLASSPLPDGPTGYCVLTTLNNYKTMNSIIYSDCESVVILVPKDALKTS